MRRGRIGATWGCVVGAALVAACRSVPERPLDRFIATDPVESAGLRTLVDSTTVRAWEGEALLADWTVSGEDATARVTDHGVELSAARDRAYLTARLDLDAAAFDALEVRRRVPETILPARLAWTRPDAGLSRERSIAGQQSRERTLAATIHFPLAGHVEWRDRVATIRLAFAPPGITIERIALVRERLSAQRPARLQAGFKAELQSEVRNALPAFPGDRHELAGTVPPGARLRFSYGVQGRPSAPLRFAASFHAEGGSGRRLFEAVVDPGTEGAAGAWHEGEVDLAALAGRAGVLRLETSAEGPFDAARALPLWANPEVVPAPAGHPNILLISVDTLRADRLSLYGYGRPTTPQLEAWAADSAAVFRTVVAQAPWTLPSHASMLTGLDPLRHGVNHPRDFVHPGLVTLPLVLRAAGYRTLAITGGAYLSPRYGFTQGFDRYWHFTGNRSHYDELDVELEQARRWLAEDHGAPLFLFFHTYSVHAPFKSRQPYFDQFVDLAPVTDLRIRAPDGEAADGYLRKVELEDMYVAAPASRRGVTGQALAELASAAYDSGVAHADAKLAELLAAVRAAGLGDDTLVVLTSDHGEMLGEGGLVSHRYLHEENILVPLVVADPRGRGAGRVIPDQVRSVDIAPTILDLAGLDPIPGIDGRSLVPLLEGEPSSVPAEAWTYASHSNYGISLRLDGELAYWFNDTVWPPIRGAEHLRSLGAGSAATAAAPDSARRRHLRRRVREAFAGAPGLRVRFVNAGPLEVTGTLAGRAIAPNTVKSVDLGCDCLALAPSRLDFRVPPGTSYTLLLGTSTRGLALTLAAPGSGGEDYQATYSPEALVVPRLVGLAGGGWTALDAAERPRTSVRLWLETLDPSPQEPDEIDAELLDRLRALGYVE